MSKTLKRKWGIFLIVIVCVVGGYGGWQFYQAKHLASNLLAEAEKAAQNTGSSGTGSENPGGESSGEGQAIGAGTSSKTADNTGSQTNSAGVQSGEVSQGSTSTEVNYKKKMENTYNSALGAMSSVKANTLALQQRKLSLSQYKGSIQQAKNTFTEAQTFAQNNPPSDPKLTPYYQEFLAGIILSNQSMDTVLSGISSLSPSSLYAAKDMGTTARDKVVSAFNHF